MRLGSIVLFRLFQNRLILLRIVESQIVFNHFPGIRRRLRQLFSVLQRSVDTIQEIKHKEDRVSVHNKMLDTEVQTALPLRKMEESEIIQWNLQNGIRKRVVRPVKQSLADFLFRALAEIYDLGRVRLSLVSILNHGLFVLHMKANFQKCDALLGFPNRL